MKRLLLLFLFIFCFSLSAGTSQVLHDKVQFQNSLTSVSQNVTGSWVDLGSPIDVRKFNKLTLWIKLDINNAENVRLRLSGLHTESGDEYLRIIKTAGASAIAFEAEYYELNVDGTDINFVNTFDVDAYSYVQVQVMAGTVGATPAAVTASHYTLLSR